jgi:hypothetical protein
VGNLFEQHNQPAPCDIVCVLSVTATIPHHTTTVNAMCASVVWPAQPQQQQLLAVQHYYFGWTRKHLKRANTVRVARAAWGDTDTRHHQIALDLIGAVFITLVTFLATGVTFLASPVPAMVVADPSSNSSANAPFEENT